MIPSQVRLRKIKNVLNSKSQLHIVFLTCIIIKKSLTLFGWFFKINIIINFYR